MADGVARPRVYLAGPEVFLPDAAELGAAKVARCRAHGLEGLWPGDAVAGLAEGTDLHPSARGHALFTALAAQLDACDAVIANLTPFRGPSADVGTVWEVGYACGRGLPVFAYTNVTTHYAARVAADGFAVEAFDFADNLMLEASVSGGGGLRRVDGGPDPASRLRHLRGFEACVRDAAALLLGEGGREGDR